MKYTKLVFMLFLLFIDYGLYSQEKMEIEGAIIIANSEGPDPTPGTIRFNPATCDFEGWNGVFWASLTGFLMNSVADVDGNTYKTITIGEQEWMAENLRTTKYKNGDAIPNVTNNTDWSNLGSGAYCWYENDNSYEQPYGKLYNWYAVNNALGLCPTGWHEPTDVEWTVLTNFLGGSGAGGAMKEAGSAHWLSPNTGATNTSGFTGLPGGFRDTTGPFDSNFSLGIWWSSTDSGSSAWCRSLNHLNFNVFRPFFNKRLGLSVRCVRD